MQSFLFDTQITELTETCIFFRVFRIRKKKTSQLSFLFEHTNHRTHGKFRFLRVFRVY